MDRPRDISSGEAMRWNEDVERRRREYHEQRCAENALYRRAYERQQEMRRRIQRQASEALSTAVVHPQEEVPELDWTEPHRFPCKYQQPVRDYEVLGC